MALLPCWQLDAQPAMMVGYQYSSGSFNTLNKLTQSFNTKFKPTGKGFSNFSGMNGLSLGFKQRFGKAAFNLGWRYSFAVRKSIGVPNSAGGVEDRSWTLQNNAYNIGLEAFVSEYFSLGSDLLWDFYRFREKIGNVNKVVMKDKLWAVMLYGSLNIPGTEIISLSLRPFVNIPFTSFSLDPVVKKYELEDVSNLNYKDLTFGISVIFNNGPTHTSEED